ncbi:hypothetical protein DV737_g5232, partial [Chaetothyriales sp. CBS 132003]
MSRQNSADGGSRASSSHTSPQLSPRVQLVPHSRTTSYDMPLSDADREVLRLAHFDRLDLSSQDFDFEDIFTYDKPQKKLTKVVEVSSPTRERDWSSFSFSHYKPALSARQRVNNRSKTSVSAMYLRNQQAQERRRVLCDHTTASITTATHSHSLPPASLFRATPQRPSWPRADIDERQAAVLPAALAAPQPSQPNPLHPQQRPSFTSAPACPCRRQRLPHGLAPRRLTTPVLPAHHAHPPPPKRRSRTLSHAPSMPVHIASVMSTPYTYPSFMSVYGGDESQLEDIPDCVCYEQAKEQDRRAGQISSNVHSAPAPTPPASTHHTLPLAIHHRGSINSSASDSTAPSPTTTSYSSPSFTDPSPTSSPESACSNPYLSEPAVYPALHSPGYAGRNVKKLSLNMASVVVPRAGSLAAADAHLPFSAPSSPLKEPLRSARKKPTNLTIRTPAFQPLALPRTPAEVPPTPSSRPSLHTFASSPSLPSLNTPTTSSSGLHVSLPSFGSGHSRPGSESSVSSQCVSALPELREEFEPPKSQETQENGYPDGPVCIYDCGVYLYLEPTAAEARQFDTVINVAKEIKNPFDRPSAQHRTVMATWRERESRDHIPEPQTAISQASFAALALERQPEYVHVPWDHNSEIMDDLPPLCRLIDDRTRRGKKVLIHCQLGVSRSASLTIAYGLWVGYQPDFHSMYVQVKRRSPWNKDVSADDPSKTPTAKTPRPLKLDKELPPVPLFEQEANPRALPHLVTHTGPARVRGRTASPPAAAAATAATVTTAATATTAATVAPAAPAITAITAATAATAATYANPRPIPPHKPRRAPPPAGVAVDRAQASAQMDLASQDVPHTPSLFSPRSAEFVAAPIGISHSVGEIVVAGPPDGTAHAIFSKSRPQPQPQPREDALPSTADPRSPHQSPDSNEILGSIDGVL